MQEKAAVTLKRTAFELAAQGELFHDVSSDPCLTDKNGLSLLHVAAMHGQLPTVRRLLKQVPDCRVRDIRGHTALHYAAFYGHQHVVRELLQFSPQLLDDVDCEGNSALMTACYQKRIHVVHELLKCGADMSLLNVNQESCFSIAQAVGAKDALTVMEKRVLEFLERHLFQD